MWLELRAWLCKLHVLFTIEAVEKNQNAERNKKSLIISLPYPYILLIVEYEVT